MAKKKEKEEKIEEQEKNKKEEKPKKIEKKVVKKQEDKQPQLFSLKELADIFGVSVYQMSINFSVRGIDRSKKISLEEAKKIM